MRQRQPLKFIKLSIRASTQELLPLGISWTITDRDIAVRQWLRFNPDRRGDRGNSGIRQALPTPEWDCQNAGMPNHLSVRTQGELNEAIAYVRGKGCDLFRGQSQRWPVRSSLYRLSGVAREEAGARLEAFIHWCEAHPRLFPYSNSRLNWMAMAQHYGVPTPLLDASLSPEVATHFATCDADSRASGPVVFAWRTADLMKTSGVAVHRIDIENLWRINAQKSVFVECGPGLALDEGVDCYAIALDGDPGVRWATLAQDEVMPSRKSILEIILDDYFYRVEMEGMFDNFKGIQLKRRWQSYAGAFRERRIRVPGTVLASAERAWSARWNARQPTAVQVVDIVAGTAATQGDHRIESALAEYCATGAVPVFDLRVVASERQNRELSRLINHVFDGIAALPFDADTLTTCLKRCVRFVVCLGRESETAFREDIETTLGATVSVEFAPWNGFHNAALASSDGLVRCLSAQAVAELRPFYRRAVESSPLDLLCLSMDPLHAMQPEAFSRLFGEEVIPTQVALWASEQLKIDEGEDWPTAPMVFDPLLLSYFSVSEYAFKFPFAFELEIESLLLLHDGMTTADIRDEIISAWPRCRDHQLPFVVRFHGFDRDDRELYEIPGAVQLATVFLSLGGLSILEVATFTRPRGDDIRRQVFPRPMGAFEMWLYFVYGAKSPLTESAVRATQPDFQRALLASNEVLESLLREAGVPVA